MSPTDDLSLIRVATGQLEGLIAAVGPDEADLPTPCVEWTVRDLVDHVIATTAQFVEMARGGEPDWSAPAPRAGEPVTEFHRHADDLLAVIEAGETISQAMPAAELAVHTWDLATSLGRSTDDLDPRPAESGLAFMTASLTDDLRGDAFAAARIAPDGANPYERIAAFSGREVPRRAG